MGAYAHDYTYNSSLMVYGANISHSEWRLAQQFIFRLDSSFRSIMRVIFSKMAVDVYDQQMTFYSGYEHNNLNKDNWFIPCSSANIYYSVLVASPKP